MVHGEVTLSQTLAFVTQPIEPQVLQGVQIVFEHRRQFVTRHGTRGLTEGAHVSIGRALSVAGHQRGGGDQAQLRLHGRVDGMRRQVRPDRTRAPREAAQVQEARHLRPVVDRVVVPQRRLAPQRIGHARQVADADLAGADLFARPVDTDAGIEPAPELIEVVSGALAKDEVQHHVVGIVGRAHDDPAGAGGGQRGMHDLGLACRQVRHIASGVVEEDRKIVDADLVECAQLGCEVGLRGAGVVSVQLVGAQADAEAHAQAAAMRRQIGQLGEGRRRVRLAPAAPQEGIRLGRVVEPRVAQFTQPRQYALAVLVTPRLAEIALDDAQLWNHAAGHGVGHQEQPDLLTVPGRQGGRQSQGVVGTFVAIGRVVEDEQGRSHGGSWVLQRLVPGAPDSPGISSISSRLGPARVLPTLPTCPYRGASSERSSIERMLSIIWMRGKAWVCRARD
jgi:hypothetical protein